MRRIVPLALPLALALSARAEEAAAETSGPDAVALDSCLALVARKASAAPPKDEFDEKPGAEGRLAAAVEKAGQDKASCIGAVAAACLRRQGTPSNAAQIDCYGREASVWDGRLNHAYRAALGKMERDAADNLKKAQRSWLAWRNANCAEPALVFKGAMAGPMQAWCVLDLTARQALSIEGWTE